MSALRRGVALSSSRFCASLLRHGYRVLAFGQGNSGALGLGDLLDSHDPALVGDLPDDVVSIACGHFHSVAVTGEGEVFTWGRNNEGQLGHGGQSDFNPNVCDLPRRASEGEMAGARVREASASGVCTFAVAEDGRAFSWGSSKRGQLGLGAGVFSSAEPAQIACRLPLRTISAGWGHAVAIADTELGELVSWGYPVHGRLGYGHSEIGQQSQQEAPQGAANAPGMSAEEGEMAAACVWQPREVGRLSGIKIVGAACGADHTIVVTEWGAVFAFGDNSMFQLGSDLLEGSGAMQDLLQGEPSLSAEMSMGGGGGLHRTDSLGSGASEVIQSVLFPIPVRVGQVATGYAHTLCLASRADPSDPSFGEVGCLLSWGWDTASQLGHDGAAFDGLLGVRPAFVQGFEGVGAVIADPVKVAAGRVHSAALTRGGDLYTWGSSKNGRLGFDCLSSSETVGATAVPQKVELPEELGVRRIVDVACGYDHTLLLVE